MNFKEFVDLGGTLTIPYKENLENWYSYITLNEIGGVYVLIGGPFRAENYDSFESAFEAFEKCFDNIGIIQRKIMAKHPELEFDRTEDENFIKLKKLVEQYKKEKQNV